MHREVCQPGRCFDGALFDGLQSSVWPGGRNKLVVLHQMGNHGRSYFHRYPDRFRRFIPTCDTAELQRCSIQEIVNSYDNALLYTDHFLAQAIAFLTAQEKEYDTALLYVSDHGESLGENGLFLNGITYAIAPQLQTKMPMLLWLSEGFRREFGADEGCIRRRADRMLSHDNLFHTVLGLLQVETAARDPRYDLSDGCWAPVLRPAAGSPDPAGAPWPPQRIR